MTAPWRLQLRPGSFRGVKFFVDSHDFEGGRRIISHLFPYKDTPWTEDFGRNQRSYRLSIYVVGEDYFPARDALIDAFEKGGPGILVHPYLGNKTVEAADFSVSETRDQGGMAMINITFKETGRIPSPEGTADLFEQAKSAANSVQLALMRAFNSFNSPNPTSFVFQSAIGLVTSVSDILGTAAGGVPTGNAGISDLAYAIRNLKGNSRALVQKPSLLSANIVGSLKLLTGTLNLRGLLPEDANGKVKVTRDAGAAAKTGYTVRALFSPLILFGGTLPTTLSTTDARRLEKQNQDLMRQLVVGSSLGEAVIVSSATDYGTYEDALAQRDFLVDRIENLMEEPTIPDDVYSALQGLLATAVEAIPDPNSEAPRLSHYTINEVTPSLVVAYQLYETLDLESDIIARNRISNPAFISPVKPLEVLAGE